MIKTTKMKMVANTCARDYIECNINSIEDENNDDK